MPIVGNQVCNLHYRKVANTTKPIKDDMLCAWSEGQDSCQVGPQTHPLICPQPLSGGCLGSWEVFTEGCFPAG